MDPALEQDMEMLAILVLEEALKPDMQVPGPDLEEVLELDTEVLEPDMEEVLERVRAEAFQQVLVPHMVSAQELVDVPVLAMAVLVAHMVVLVLVMATKVHGRNKVLALVAAINLRVINHGKVLVQVNLKERKKKTAHQKVSFITSIIPLVL